MKVVLRFLIGGMQVTRKPRLSYSGVSSVSGSGSLSNNNFNQHLSIPSSQFFSNWYLGNSNPTSVSTHLQGK